MVDIHLHLADFKDSIPHEYKDSLLCSCAYKPASVEIQNKRAVEAGAKDFALAYGFHPWYTDFYMSDFELNLNFLEQLCSSGKISAIGECGFDFYDSSLVKTQKEQALCFEKSLQFSKKYEIPLIIHERKGMEWLYRYSKQLKECPKVVFHSFSHGIFEARSILSKGIDAFFSFGNSVVKNVPKAVDCIESLPVERILTETDAPFGSVKIDDVMQKTASIKKISAKDFCLFMENNFYAVFENMRNKNL